MKIHVLFLAFVLIASPIFAQTAEWVWADQTGAKPPAGEARWFRKTFHVGSNAEKAVLNAAADGELTVYLNGKEVAKSASWKEPVKLDVTKAIKNWSENTLAVEAKVGAGKPALVVVLDITHEYSKRQVVMTDRSWLVGAEAPEGWNQPGFKAGSWQSVKRVADLGAAPWGNLFNVQSGATPAEELKVAPGFKIELLKSATPRDGSWVSMAVDDRGRLYVSPQNFAADGCILRLTLDERGQIAKEDWIDLKVGAAMAMLWAFDSLYVSGQGPQGQAIYRLRDTNADGDLDKVELFKKVTGGGGEHGAHALVVGPDQQIYIAHGNSTPPVEGLDPASPYRHYAEDDLLPRIKDPVATFFDKLKSPYGYILRTDADGKKWELFAGGFRNQYDIDFNADGELFTYDSDMEWDVGLPWYRHTRILHIIAGAEFGFREGNSKWPDYYADSLGAVVDIGRGSPTGVKFGTRSNFPEKYQRAFYAMDWTYGRILAVHMRPKGASYTASNPLPSRFDIDEPSASEDVEVFVSGKGLPVTDLEFGKDGAMYFTVGGRGTQAGLYRVSYVGEAEDEATREFAALAALHSRDLQNARSARAFRRQLEAEPRNSGIQDYRFAQKHDDFLERFRAASDGDRSLYFAARIRAEQLPLEALRQLVVEEPAAGTPKPPGGLFFGPHEPPNMEKGRVLRSRDSLMAVLALARVGTKEDQAPLLNALTKFPLDSLDDELKLLKLRVLEVSFIRQGRPSEEMVKLAIGKLSRQFPAKSFDLNRELSQLLVWLDAPDVVEKTLALMKATPAHAEQIWYANVLREAKQWTPAQREEYFAWFNRAAEYKGGNSAGKFILRIREEALKKVPDDQRERLAALLETKPATTTPPPPAVVRSFQKAWTVADLAPDLAQAAKGRNFARGKEIYASTQCAQCHRFGKEGGNVGPDLSGAGNRFNLRDLLEATVDPSKAISEQYASVVITMKDGTVLVGQIAEQDNHRLRLVTDPVAGKNEWLRLGQIASREISPVSLMPPGLINVLTKEEVLDLLAYLASGGDEKAAAFTEGRAPARP